MMSSASRNIMLPLAPWNNKRLILFGRMPTSVQPPPYNAIYGGMDEDDIIRRVYLYSPVMLQRLLCALLICRNLIRTLVYTL